MLSLNPSYYAISTEVLAQGVDAGPIAGMRLVTQAGDASFPERFEQPPKCKIDRITPWPASIEFSLLGGLKLSGFTVLPERLTVFLLLGGIRIRLTPPIHQPP